MSGCHQEAPVENKTPNLKILTQVKADQRLNAAVERLTKVSTFAFGGVGFAGVESEGEADYRVVMSQPYDVALAVLEKLFANGNTEAKCYALAGIKKLSPTRFKELLASARKSSDEVQVMRGCIMSHEPMRAVAQQIADGEFQSRFE